MKTIYFGMAMVAIAAGAPVQLFATDGEPIAETSSAATFRLYVNDGNAYTLESAAEVAAWPVTWQACDEVSAMAMDGTAYVLADGVAAAGSAVLATAKGGIWTLTDTSETGRQSAKVSVPWSVCQSDGVPLSAASETSDAFGIDVEQDGPDRKSRDSRFLPIAYSGDDWGARSASAASTLTVTPPAAQTDPSVFDLVGTGVQPFAFNHAGRWTVLLEMADGTARTATINRLGGMTISFY